MSPTRGNNIINGDSNWKCSTVNSSKARVSSIGSIARSSIEKPMMLTNVSVKLGSGQNSEAKLATMTRNGGNSLEPRASLQPKSKKTATDHIS